MPSAPHPRHPTSVGTLPAMPGVELTIDGPVATLALARPEVLNALDDGVRRALDQALVTSRRATTSGSSCCGARGRASRRAPTCEHRLSAHRGLLDRAPPGDRHLAAAARAPGPHAAGDGGRARAATSSAGRPSSPRPATCGWRPTTPVLRIPELAIGIPLTWAGIPLLVREVGLPLTRDWVMTCRAVRSDELLRSGYAQRVVPVAEHDAAVARCVDELVAVPAGPLAMTKAMTSALSRTHPAMAAGWADADLQLWAFGEPEGRDATRAYLDQQRRT